MKLNLKILLKDLDGNILKDQDGKDVLLSRWLANALAQHSVKGNAAQYFDWSMQLWKTGAIDDIDKSNIAKLKDFAESMDAPVLIIGQAIKALEGAK